MLFEEHDEMEMWIAYWTKYDKADRDPQFAYGGRARPLLPGSFLPAPEPCSLFSAASNEGRSLKRVKFSFTQKGLSLDYINIQTGVFLCGTWISYVQTTWKSIPGSLSNWWSVRRKGCLIANEMRKLYYEKRSYLTQTDGMLYRRMSRKIRGFRD
jgi:hypothetical protein